MDQSDDKTHDDLQLDSTTHYRSPTFSKAEVEYLLELIEKYKSVILNRLITSDANTVKDVTWAKITKAFNSRGLKTQRTPEVLKTKWHNLRRMVRNSSKNVIDVRGDHGNSDHYNRILALVCEQESMSLDTSLEIKIVQEENSKNAENSWDIPLEEKNTDDDSEDENEKKNSRSNNFSPSECKILLECISKEKDMIFNKSPNLQKNKAWHRVAKEFNSQSNVKRPIPVLRNKFHNMRRGARRGELQAFGSYFQDEGWGEAAAKKIKSEPANARSSTEMDYNEDIDSSFAKSEPPARDPLEAVLFATADPLMPWNQPESKDVVKLKTELLNCQIENAKLEKQRILQATQAEATEQESKSLLLSLKIREARLAAAAAALQLPPAHPALDYKEREAAAREYMQQ